jgi:hypothetical protein
MTINFFNENCLSSTNSNVFGICDGLNDAMAFLDFHNQPDWICSVLNENATLIEFRAIDNCIIVLKENLDKERSCDCMLTYFENIVFIELKEKRGRWIQDGFEQIEKTIEAFKENHNIDDFKHKRAFVANKKHPNFHVIENETMRKFYSKHKVRLNVQAEVIIK